MRCLLRILLVAWMWSYIVLRLGVLLAVRRYRVRFCVLQKSWRDGHWSIVQLFRLGRGIPRAATGAGGKLWACAGSIRGGAGLRSEAMAVPTALLPPCERFTFGTGGVLGRGASARKEGRRRSGRMRAEALPRGWPVVADWRRQIGIGGGSAAFDGGNNGRHRAGMHQRQTEAADAFVGGCMACPTIMVQLHHSSRGADRQVVGQELRWGWNRSCPGGGQCAGGGQIENHQPEPEPGRDPPADQAGGLVRRGAIGLSAPAPVDHRPLLVKEPSPERYHPRVISHRRNVFSPETDLPPGMVPIPSWRRSNLPHAASP